MKINHTGVAVDINSLKVVTPPVMINQQKQFLQSLSTRK